MHRPNVIVWLLRLGWLLVPIALGPAVAAALDGRSDRAAVVVQIALWSFWAVGLVATLVVSTVSLTVVRLLAPAGVVVATIAAFTGASVGATALAVAGASVVAVLAFAAEIGEAFVQGSAYGDERRFPLRPPATLLAGPLPLAWLVLAAPTTTGILLLAAGRWVVGGALVALAAVLAVLLGPRFHRISRRFVVLVPAGLVVHDDLVLAQTAMFRQGDVGSLGLALDDTTATDLTGTTVGNAVEVQLRRPGQVLVAGTRGQREGRSAAVGHFLVAPSRPGRLLDEAASRGYRVASGAGDTGSSDAAVPPPST